MRTILAYLVCFFSISTTLATPAKYNNSSSQGFANTTSTDIFGRIHAHRQHNGVALTWYTINKENVNSFIIERSYDGSFYETIDEVEVSTSADYHYSDNQIFPGYLYYRIGAVMNDGSIIYSEVEMLRIVSRKGW